MIRKGSAIALAFVGLIAASTEAFAGAFVSPPIVYDVIVEVEEMSGGIATAHQVKHLSEHPEQGGLTQALAFILPSRDGGMAQDELRVTATPPDNIETHETRTGYAVSLRGIRSNGMAIRMIATGMMHANDGGWMVIARPFEVRQRMYRVMMKVNGP